MMSEVNDLIQRIDIVRSEMKVVVEGTDPNLEIFPGWTIKEVLVNITSWEIVIHKAILAFRAGDPPYFLREQDFDLFNKNEVEKRSEWGLEQVIREWEEEREDLKKTILKLKETDLPIEMVLPWGSDRTVYELIEIIEEHEFEHMEDIKKATK
jgi:hypothetical protein